MKNQNKYFIIEPEVAGTLGKHTKREASVHPPVINKLHYIIENWLGDDIIAAFPVMLITEKLKKLIEDANLTGYEISDCELSISDNYLELKGNSEIPIFYWFKITSSFFETDFLLNQYHHLVVSEKALNILKNARIEEANILPIYSGKGFEYHDYDIELTRLHNSLEQRFGKKHELLITLNNIIKKSPHISEEYKRQNETLYNIFIVKSESYIYDTMLALKLILAEKYEIPDILDYQYNLFTKNSKGSFLDIAKYDVLLYLKNIEGVKLTKTLTTINKWVAKKRKTKTESTSESPDSEVTKLLVGIFKNFSQKEKIGKKYLEASNPQISYIVSKLQHTNNYNPNFKKGLVKINWNLGVIDITYIFHKIYTTKINRVILLPNIDKQKLTTYITSTFLYKKTELLEKTVNDKLNDFINGDILPKYHEEFDAVLKESGLPV